jgi:small-conductance mechanosensitive channel
MPLRVFLACIALFTGLSAAAAQAPQAAAPQQGQAAPPIRVIIEVPNDAAGRAYVSEKIVPQMQPAGAAVPTIQPAAGKTQPPAQPSTTTSAFSSGTLMGSEPADMSAMAADELSAVRDRAKALVEAAPHVPDEIADASRRFLAMGMGGASDAGWLVVALFIFVLGGLVARRIAWWSARGLLAKNIDSPAETVGQRLRLHGMRITIAIYVLAAFVVGSIGAFLLFPWPPVIRETVLVLLAYAVLLAFANAVGRVVIAPGARHDYFRVVPLSRTLAAFWYRTLLWFVVVVGAAVTCATLMKLVGVSLLSRQVVMGAWLTAIAVMLLVRLWIRNHIPGEEPPGRVPTVLFAAFVLLAWGLGALHLRQPFFTLVVLVAMPATIRVMRAAVRNVVRPHEQSMEERSAALAWAVVVERALRVLIVVVGASILADIWNIDVSDIAMGESLLTRSVRAVFRVLIILLVADLIWQITRAIIDGRLDGSPLNLHDESPEARRRQRLATLLPILRNFLFAILLSVTVLMVMDSMGIQIGPLLAGAGVIGIAVGFGAQTLVKDIISGIFYLLDDAFRVGEYIQTSSHKGTVESFSLRSVKLRHHRGPLTTVPFGTLGAVQNLSRDWVIDKITIGVTYDTDLDKAKKLIKEVGRQLAADPEFSPHIIEPLKMQGVEQLGDFAIQLRLKMMTKPGEQFVIRRRAYALIKKAFEENGIRFALPTVQVGAQGDAMFGAAAQRALELSHAPAAGEEARRAKAAGEGA